MMDYGAILKKSWLIVKKYRFLWWLGLLSLCAESGSGFGGYSGGGGSSYKPSNLKAPTVPSGQHTAILDKAKSIPRVLGASDNKISDFFNSAVSWSGHHWLALLLTFLVIFGIYVLIMYIAESARAGLVLSVVEIEKNDNELGFKKAYHLGRKYAWRLLGQTLLVGLSMCLILAAIILVTFLPYLMTGVKENLVFSMVIGLLLLLPFVILCIFVNIWLRLSARYLILNDSGIMESLHGGVKLFRKQIGKVLLTWLIELGLSIVISLCFIIAVFIAALILIGIGLLIYALAKTTGAIIFGTIISILFVLIIFLFSAILNTFFSTYWTISYRAINYINSKQNR